MTVWARLSGAAWASFTDFGTDGGAAVRAAGVSGVVVGERSDSEVRRRAAWMNSGNELHGGQRRGRENREEGASLG